MLLVNIAFPQNSVCQSHILSHALGEKEMSRAAGTHISKKILVIAYSNCNNIASN